MRALLAQLDPGERSPQAGAERVGALLAAHPDAELAVFPELFLGGYRLAQAPALALARTDAPLAHLGKAARTHGTALLVGFAERRQDGRVANAVACVDAGGELLGVYRKTHLFGGAEARAFAPGDELLVVDLAGHPVGVLVCFDMEFPEPARALARAGAELLVTLAANPEPYGPEHALAARARALDNRRTHLYVNRVGEQDGLRFAGGSCALDPAGGLLAASGPGEQVLVVDVPVGEPAEEDVHYLSHIRDGLETRRIGP